MHSGTKTFCSRILVYFSNTKHIYPSGLSDMNSILCMYFRIPAGTFIKLHQGTWHAGPLFEEDSMAFYNLELSDTNVVDHNTHDYSNNDLQFLLVDK